MSPSFQKWVFPNNQHFSAFFQFSSPVLQPPGHSARPAPGRTRPGVSESLTWSALPCSVVMTPTPFLLATPTHPGRFLYLFLFLFPVFERGGGFWYVWWAKEMRAELLLFFFGRHYSMVGTPIYSKSAGLKKNTLKKPKLDYLFNSHSSNY